MLLLLKIAKMCQLVVSMMWIASETRWLPDVGCLAMVSEGWMMERVAMDFASQSHI